jgi:phosphoribosylamine-glycine ligase
MLKFPNNDTFIAYCATKGYPTQYNDGLKVALQTDLTSSKQSLNDLMKEYFDTNGAEYLYP